MTLNRKRAADSYAQEEDEGGREGKEAGSRFILYFLAAAAILLVFGVLVAGTAGFRELVSVKNEQWTQTRVVIGGSRIALPYDLVLTDVTVPDKARADGAGLKIPEVRLFWRPGKGLQVTLARPDVRLVQPADGVIEPDELSRLGTLRHADDVTEWLAHLQGRVTLHIEQATLEVVDPEGKRIRRMEGIRLTATPVTLPGRPAVYYDFSSGPMAGPDGHYEERGQQWLSWDGTNRADLGSDVVGGGKAGGPDFWKGMQP
ncbi:MAG: hypothetical protein R6X19_03515 [Kiritimatiellia bacterium]